MRLSTTSIARGENDTGAKPGVILNIGATYRKMNDVDLSLKIRATGRRIVVTPHARLYHFESVTRNPTVSDVEMQRLQDRWLPQLRRERAIDFVIANAENAAAGAGITGALARSILGCGVDAITLGDHVWDQRGWENEITEIDRVCRPANLPKSNPGWDHLIIEARGFRVAVFTVLGRTFMGLKADCPFLCADRMIAQLRPQCDAIIVEIHGEATSEKIALGWHLDGRVTAVLGTHTHVPTADHRILPGGTAVMGDAGMCGDYESILGMDRHEPIRRFLQKTPGDRMEPASGPGTLCGVAIETDDRTGLATKCAAIRIGPHLEESRPTFWE